jgi:hypothetical protein
MRKLSMIGKITLGIGLIFFIFGCVHLLGLLNVFSMNIPNKSIAFGYLLIGISLIFSSFFYTNEHHK